MLILKVPKEDYFGNKIYNKPIVIKSIYCQKGITKLGIIVFTGIILFITIAVFILNRNDTLFNRIYTLISSRNGQKVNSKLETFNGQPINSCTRNTPFPIAPEFERALSLLDQRSGREERVNEVTKVTENVSIYFPALNVRNCLNIMYSDNMPNIDHVGAWFDSENSTPNDLIIKINSTYQNQHIDDLVMAMLLAHELVHVDQFNHSRVTPGVKWTCLDQESEAFIMQLKLLAILHPDEQTKLTKLMKSEYYYILGTLYDLWILQDKAYTICNESKDKNSLDQNSQNICFWQQMEPITKAYIQTIPGYQQSCKLF